MIRKKRSILFVRPDFHTSFIYRQELRKLGWKADIYVESSYPEGLLWSRAGVRQPPRLGGDHFMPIAWINRLLNLGWYLLNFWRYRYHVYYGRPPRFSFSEERIGITRLFGSDFLVELWLAKLFGCKLVYMPTGCNDELRKAEFMRLDAGQVCANCGFFDRCDDTVNNQNFSRVRRFFDLMISNGTARISQYNATPVRWKAIDLDLWTPSLEVPPEHRLPHTDRIRILHSSYLKNSGRSWQGRDIKGSGSVFEAIERLKTEGHPVEFYFLENVQSAQMRFYQCQADIVVEQLRYGWYGSTGVEAMALGKPVVCYIRPEWKETFLKTYPEHDSLPIVEADTRSVYDVLKRLVTDEEFRRRKGTEARRFAERLFDPVRNAREFAETLEAL